MLSRNKTIYFILASLLIIFAVYLQVVEEPFFVGAELAKHKATEWLYDILGANGLSALALGIAVAFIVSAFNTRKM